MFPQLTVHRPALGAIWRRGERTDRLAALGLEPALAAGRRFWMWPSPRLHEPQPVAQNVATPPAAEVDEDPTTEVIADVPLTRPFVERGVEVAETASLSNASEVLAELRADDPDFDRVAPVALEAGIRTARRVAAYGDPSHAVATVRELLLDHVDPEILVTALGAWEGAHPDVPVDGEVATRPDGKELDVEQVLALRAAGYYGVAVAA